MEVRELKRTKRITNQAQVLIAQWVLVHAAQSGSPLAVQVDHRVMTQRLNKNRRAGWLEDASQLREYFVQIEMMQNPAAADEVEAATREGSMLCVHQQVVLIGSVRLGGICGLLDRDVRDINTYEA